MSEDLIRALPIWRGSIFIEPLKGGLSNESWLVKDRVGRHVVRLGKDYPFHHVFREREIMTARAAAQAGFAPEVRYSEPGVIVTAYLGAKTYGAEDVRANIKRIARIMRSFHEEMPRHVSGAGFMFWPFHVIRDYARTLEAANSRMTRALPSYLALAEELEAAQTALPIVFGHNDLLPANFLDDGKRLWLIDFEYAGFSTAMFDLAGVASNASMTAAESEMLLAAYFGSAPSAEIRRSHAAMQCASLLREAMWSMVSELHLDAPGVDYVAYTDENLSRLDAALDAYHSAYGKS
ncbi:phosphotransferase family protein [Mesorhizobium sp. BAC0120]|uniref:phosphotransferase family protein n=1 Tax=Mesorhizobium sp. BAC0120 TaxID=3090670 RepID=UPI00298C2480|nr:phosphotransferase family protein [Mesorhizobium sp. BAC0120]MDW6025243.1 phosphotransferase family protein [Mesorhizobium sp. BAC0120]